MAKQVKLKGGREFNFAQATRQGAEAKYPWDEWFNGTLLLLERHEGVENEKGTITEEAATEKKDFGVSVNAMVPKLNTAARRRYKVCDISRFDADGKRLKDALIIRARDMTQEERAEEDALRAEEKAKARARRAGASANGHGEPSDEDAGE